MQPYLQPFGLQTYCLRNHEARKRGEPESRNNISFGGGFVTSRTLGARWGQPLVIRIPQLSLAPSAPSETNPIQVVVVTETGW